MGRRPYFFVLPKPIKSQGRYFLILQRYKTFSGNASDLPTLTLENLVIVQKITCCAALPQLGTKETGLAALFRFCRAFLLSSIIIPTERINASDGLKTAIKSVLCFLRYAVGTALSKLTQHPAAT